MASRTGERATSEGGKSEQEALAGARGLTVAFPFWTHPLTVDSATPKASEIASWFHAVS
jgi:hypothetical protein